MRHAKPHDPAPHGSKRPHGTRGSAAEHLHVRRGDTLEAILAARGVSGADAQPWLRAAARVYDLRFIHPRRGVNLRFDRDTHELEAVRYQIDDRTLLVLEDHDGRIDARRESLPYFVEVKGVAGRIARGFREDVADSGVPPRVVSDLADIFGWDIDVGTDLRPGDEYRVLYEDIWQAGGAQPEPGHVLGAEIVAAGRNETAVFFEDRDGNGGYYAPNGAPLSRAFLRYPVEFTEITSEFSLLRRHPILHRSRPHLGVDFAAPTGTPVRAVADGFVTYSGWVSQLGRCVRIDHAATALTSSYGHLARIAAGVTPGVAVKRGQVIGYVGATGLATGPHLHYALDHDGEYVDPLTASIPGEAAIPAALRHAFDRVRNEVTRELASLPATAHPLTVSLSDTHAALE